MRAGAAAALLCLTVLSAPAEAVAQWRSDRVSALGSSALGSSALGSSVPQAEPVPSIRPTLLSLVLPGAGQHVLHQRRKWAYFALEVVGWAAYLNRHRAGDDLRDRYRDFAWDQGRIQTLPRVEGDFDYYERLSKWPRSGSFDTDPSQPGVQPEVDPDAYNGSIWALASQIFIPPDQSVPESDPRYQEALAYYTSRAYGTALLWDWEGDSGARAELGRLIEESDDRFRQATTALGLVIANHLLSAVDAYMSSRGRLGGISLQVAARPHRPGWIALVRVPAGP